MIKFLLPFLFGISAHAAVIVGGSEGARFTSPIYLDQLTTPASNPPAGRYKLYAKNDGKLYLLDSSGVETVWGGGGGGGGSGTVTSVSLTAPGIFSVGGSPVTSSGTLALSLAVQNANKVWAGPTTGGDATPTFRSLVAGDVPTLNQNTSGSAASFTGNLVGDVSGTQGATSVNRINGVLLSGLATGIVKNTTATGVPSIAIAADFPTLNQNTSGTASNVTGVVSPTNGGTGQNLSASTGLIKVSAGTVSAATLVNADVAAGAAIALNKLAATTTGRVLITDGSGFPSAASTTATQLSYLDATSSIQTQIDSKGVGTVTSVGLTMPSIFAVGSSPVTGSGSIGVTLNTQTANTFFAGPGSAGPTAPTFRSIVAADIPTLNQNTSGSAASFTGNLVGDVTGTQGATVVGKLNGVLLSGLGTGILKNTTTTGVPSIAIAADFPTLNQNTSGSAASFTGSLVGDVSGTQGATSVNKINGVTMSGLATGILKNTTTTGVPSIAVAGDFPTLNQNTTGTASNVTGTVAVANGGTGQTTYTNGQLLIGNTTGSTLAKSTLTAGNGIDITNGSGSITIDYSGVAPLNTQTSSYALVLTDKSKIVEMNSASAMNLTVPLNSSVAFPIGTQITIAQLGAGAVTVVATGGVTIRTPSSLILAEQYATALLYKRGTDEWILSGYLQP